MPLTNLPMVDFPEPFFSDERHYLTFRNVKWKRLSNTRERGPIVFILQILHLDHEILHYINSLALPLAKPFQ